jgi:hypothetical protein
VSPSGIAFYSTILTPLERYEVEEIAAVIDRCSSDSPKGQSLGLDARHLVRACL